MNIKNWVKVVTSLVVIIAVATVIAGYILYMLGVKASDETGELIVVTIFVLWGLGCLYGFLLFIYLVWTTICDWFWKVRNKLCQYWKSFIRHGTTGIFFPPGRRR